MTMRHAYLIIAHNEFEILEKQIKLLDDFRNDIYIHIDYKVLDFPFDVFEKIPQYSKLYFIDRLDVRWGDYSQIQCELLLLETATKHNYQYYHLLSGVDMPLKTNDDIHLFFEENAGKEFVHFSSKEDTENVKYRVEKYYFMHENLVMNLKGRIRKLLIYGFQWFQKRYGWKRKWDDSMPLAFGSNWFSITHELACYVLEKKKWIHKYFRYTVCGDELFLQTIVRNSDYKNRLYINNSDSYLACMRCVDWKRGTPYIYRTEDFMYLMNSPFLFARKFSANVDENIINQIYIALRKKS